MATTLAVVKATVDMPRPTAKRRATSHSRLSAGRGCMARGPRQCSVGKSALPAAKVNMAEAIVFATSSRPASITIVVFALKPKTRRVEVAHTIRMGRTSIGKSASSRRLKPGTAMINHQVLEPIAACVAWRKSTTKGVSPTTTSVHPTCHR